LDDNNITQFPLSELWKDVEPKVALLLHTYIAVLDTPFGLLLSISHDHFIPLIEHYTPIMVI